MGHRWSVNICDSSKLDFSRWEIVICVGSKFLINEKLLFKEKLILFIKFQFFLGNPKIIKVNKISAYFCHWNYELDKLYESYESSSVKWSNPNPGCPKLIWSILNIQPQGSLE